MLPLSVMIRFSGVDKNNMVGRFVEVHVLVEFYPVLGPRLIVAFLTFESCLEHCCDSILMC